MNALKSVDRAKVLISRWPKEVGKEGRSLYELLCTRANSLTEPEVTELNKLIENQFANKVFSCAELIG
jgi:UDP-N-acetyl-D-mannosaminuronate dehydrogenase